MGDLPARSAQAMLAAGPSASVGCWALFYRRSTPSSSIFRPGPRAACVPRSFVLPAVAIVGVYLVYPTVGTVGQSFTEVPEGAGSLAELHDRLHQPRRPDRACATTSIWLLVAPLASVVIGLVFAALVDRVRRESLAKTFVFLPLAISFVGASVIWGYMYAWRPAGQPQMGVAQRHHPGSWAGEPVVFIAGSRRL